MTEAGKRAPEAEWLEPLAAMVLFSLAVFINWSAASHWILAVDLLTCGGAAVSRRYPGVGAAFVGLGLAFWLPLPHLLPSMSGVAFLINIFAASRTNLSWKIPLALGFGGLAYLSLVRNVVESMDYTWTTSILLLIASAVSYGGGAAFRRAAHRVQTERKSGEQRLLQLQKSLARELHDSVAQTLSSAAMRANIVMSDSSLSPMAMGQLEKIADECRSSAHDLRQLLSALRDEPERTVTPGPLADVESLRNTVRTQAERLKDEGFTVDVKVDIDKLSAARCQTLAAITIEAANNIVKHARPGSTCQFSITQSTEDVCGEFTNVRKFSKVARQGFGLTGVQERLTLLDGTSEAIVKNGRWILRVSLPLGPDSAFSPALTTPSSEEFFSDHRSL